MLSFPTARPVLGSEQEASVLQTCGLPCGGDAVAGAERAPPGAWTQGTPELEIQSS